MTCPERRIVAFLAGELSAEEERAFDEHLIGCESCWQAVQADRAARLALERLRFSPPLGLSERVRLAIAIEAHAADQSQSPRPGARPGIVRESWHGRWARVGLAAVSVAAAVGIVVGVVLPGSAVTDPPQVAAVIAMMAPGSAPSKALLAGEQRVIDHQAILVRAYSVHGAEAIVATSMTPMPMPSASHLLGGSSPRAWMATNGSLAMYGVNRPSGERSMFLVAAMPMAELPELAAHLHLI